MPGEIKWLRTQGRTFKVISGLPGITQPTRCYHMPAHMFMNIHTYIHTYIYTYIHGANVGVWAISWVMNCPYSMVCVDQNRSSISLSMKSLSEMSRGLGNFRLLLVRRRPQTSVTQYKIMILRSKMKLYYGPIFVRKLGDCISFILNFTMNAFQLLCFVPSPLFV